MLTPDQITQARAATPSMTPTSGSPPTPPSGGGIRGQALDDLVLSNNSNTQGQSPPSSSGLGDFARSIVSAPATMLARPIQAVAELAGASEDQVDKTTNDLTGGLVAPVPRSYGDVKKDIGRGAQTVALGMGPVSGGAAFGAGTSLEQGHDLFSLNTALDTALGAGSGKMLDLLGKPIFNLAGKAVGKITPDFLQSLAGRGTQAIQDFAAHHDILPEFASNAINNAADKAEQIANKPFEMATNAVKAPINSIKNKITEAKNNAIPEAINKLEQNYVNISTGKQTLRKDFIRNSESTLNKNKAGTTGNTPQRTLAESGIIADNNGKTFTTHDQANQLKEQLRPMHDANHQALQEVEQMTPPISNDAVYNRFKNQVESNIKTKTDREAFLARGEKEIGNLGDGNSTKITELNQEKSGNWDKTKFDTAIPQLQRDYHYQIAKAMQQEIEATAERAGHPDIAQSNREIGDRMEAIKYLESLDGKKILNGQIGGHLLRIAGAITGASHGPFGSIWGALGGDIVSRVMANHSIASPFTRVLLRDLEIKDPAAYEKVTEWIKKQGLDRSNRLELPSGNQVGERDAKTGKIFGGYNPDVIPMGGKTLPSSVVVGGIKPPTSYVEAINRAKYESEKGTGPTKAYAAPSRIIDATDEKPSVLNTDKSPIVKY